MVSDGAAYLTNWWIAAFPGLGILTMSMGANFIGDGMRDLLDPKLRKEI
jgi:peptide/nickel transport system permease protein